MLAGRDVFLEKNKSPNQWGVLSFFHLLIRTKKNEPNIRVTSNIRKEQHGTFILASNLKDFFFHLQSFPAGLTIVTQHSSSNAIVISPKENLYIFIPVTSSSAFCRLLSACVTKPNSITVSVEATNPLLGFLRFWKKARTSHWHEYTVYIYSRLDSVLCPTHCFWFKTVFWGLHSCHDTLDKMLESGGIVKSKMIPLCSLWQHGLNSFIRNTCFLWQLLLIIDDKSQFLSSSQLQEGWQTLLFLHAAGCCIKMSPLCVEKLQMCSQDLMCHRSKSRLFQMR